MEWIEKYCKSHPHYLNVQDKYGRTPIMICACSAYYANEKEKEDREKIILFLLEQGAETHHKNKGGNDLLYFCKDSGLKNAENLLLKMQNAEDDEKNE